MHAIAFDLIISELKKHYKAPYNNAYAERKFLNKMVFIGYKGVRMPQKVI